MRKIFLRLCIISVISSLALTGCDLKEKYERTVDLPLAISAGQKLVVHTEVGSIKVTGSNTQQSGIKVKITGRGDTIEKAQQVAQSINIAVEDDNNNVYIKINNPPEIKSNWYSVDYTIEVPENISLEYKTNVGSATVSNIKGDIAASCNVGSITCENASGKANLNANVGNLSLAYAEDANSQANAEMSVNVGSIYFKGPKNMSAKLNVSTDVGSIHSDLPITVTGNFCSKKLNGTVGQGQGNVRMKTDVGSIDIK
jgi:hypothetical protein